MKPYKDISGHKGCGNTKSEVIVYLVLGTFIKSFPNCRGHFDAISMTTQSSGIFTIVYFCPESSSATGFLFHQFSESTLTADQLHAVCMYAYQTHSAASLTYIGRHQTCLADVMDCRRKIGLHHIDHPCFEYHGPLYSKKLNRNFTNIDCLKCIYGETYSNETELGVTMILTLEQVVQRTAVLTDPHFMYYPGTDTLVLSEYGEKISEPFMKKMGSNSNQIFI